MKLSLFSSLHYFISLYYFVYYFLHTGFKETLPTLVTLKLRIKDASLRRVLAQEVEFYQWLKSRLLNKTFNND